VQRWQATSGTVRGERMLAPRRTMRGAHWLAGPCCGELPLLCLRSAHRATADTCIPLPASGFFSRQDLRLNAWKEQACQPVLVAMARLLKDVLCVTDHAMKTMVCVRFVYRAIFCRGVCALIRYHSSRTFGGLLFSKRSYWRAMRVAPGDMVRKSCAAVRVHNALLRRFARELSSRWCYTFNATPPVCGSVHMLQILHRLTLPVAMLAFIPAFFIVWQRHCLASGRGRMFFACFRRGEYSAVTRRGVFLGHFGCLLL